MLKGVITPVVTVFDEEGKLDFKGNEEGINSLVNGGVNGLLFLGSIGEFFAMTMDERKEFIRFVIKTVNKRVPVLIGTGGTVVKEVIELTNFAKDEGADAAVVISPYYFKLNNDSLYNYFAEVAQNTELPLVLYNFPDRTAVNIDAKLVLKLAKEFKNIIGIKDTVDNISHTRQLINIVKSEIKDFAVFSGFDEYFVPNLLAGGNGLIGGLSNIAPEYFAKLFKAYNDKDFETLELLQRNVNVLMGIYTVSDFFIPAIKTAKMLTGYKIKPTCKSPASTLSEDQVEEIKEILKKAKLT
ncbi:4-hydroxy-tetrahydrodipicolinate synthase [Clostridium sp. DJ247]|uniref:4-hydroxy-tetrahydrodipicolinate synthase n=1 Tax=Clostridium sp. DJ247 TaxID=2726188 RepID=UPI001629A924|nr:4-hydroxy-tetrahydrodipicolinate synthase [Clostridium sp. DJ247]MBC2580521.1 4-hydroxy-tetrahydrodipicolinate synthase [Clostridium sp. DJ247]